MEKLERECTIVTGTGAYGIYTTSTGCNNIVFAGGLTTNSYTSANGGTYATTETASGGNILTNGSIDLAGSLTDNGNLTYNSSCSNNYAGSWTVGGTTSTSSSPASYIVPAWSGTSTSASQSSLGTCSGFSSGCTVVTGSQAGIALAPGNYNAVTTTGSFYLHLSAGTYNLYSLTFAGTLDLVVDSGPVILNFSPSGPGVTGAGSWLDNSSGPASNLQINYGGTGGITLAGASATYAVVNAPKASVTMAGVSDWYGQMIVSSVTAAGALNIHYDRNLGGGGTTGTAGNYHLTSFSWSKF